MTTWVILSLCAFFTVIAIMRPNYMWGLLSAICWMMFFWYTRSNPLTGFVIGDFGDTILISICVGASAFILIYTTIRVRAEKTKEMDKEYGESGGRGGNSQIGTSESTDAYYDRLNRLTHPKK